MVPLLQRARYRARVVDVVASSGLDIFERGHAAARVLVVDDEAREDLRLADLPHVVKMQGLRSRRGMGRIFLKGAFCRYGRDIRRASIP